MKNLLKSRNLYKLIVLIFLMVTLIKMRNQIVTLKAYQKEIVALNEKITVLTEKENNQDPNEMNSKKDNEDIARKDLKMYYPNETVYIDISK